MSEMKLTCTCYCGGSMFYRHLHAPSCALSVHGEEAPLSAEQREIAQLKAERDQLKYDREMVDLLVDNLKRSRSELSSACENLKAELETLRQQRIKYGPICVMCGAAEPCELKNDPHGPCTFDPAPKELWEEVQRLRGELGSTQEQLRLANVDQLHTEAELAAVRESRDAQQQINEMLNRELDQQQAAKQAFGGRMTDEELIKIFRQTPGPVQVGLRAIEQAGYRAGLIRCREKSSGYASEDMVDFVDWLDAQLKEGA